MADRYSGIRARKPATRVAEVTPQTQAIPGREKDMAKNNAGGISFVANEWTRLTRFLVLGVGTGGSYYKGAKDMVAENAEAVKICLKADGVRTVEAIKEISLAGRNAHDDPVLLALAMAISPAYADEATRRAAAGAVNAVCRTGSHLMQFVAHALRQRGWGYLLRNAVKGWFDNKRDDQLAYQLIKYCSRGGVNMRQVIRNSHPCPGKEGVRYELFNWVVNGWDTDGVLEAEGGTGNAILDRVWARENVHAMVARDEDTRILRRTVVAMIDKYDLPREAMPTQCLNWPEVWEALLFSGEAGEDGQKRGMPLKAMIRNLGVMTAAGLIKPLSKASRFIIDKLSDFDVLRYARVHPVGLLIAEKVYAQGHGEKGNLKWNPDQNVVDALDAAFYGSFAAVEPTGKAYEIAVDCSVSMDGERAGFNDVAGIPGMTPREAAAAIALVIKSVEKNAWIMGFTASGYGSSGIVDLPISPRMRLDQVMHIMQNVSAGRTDCALPVTHALQNGMNVDVFAVLTDNETWAGRIQPVQALQQYRAKTGIPARLATLSFVANSTTIADPQDAGMLDLVGLDPATPRLLVDFAHGAF